MKTLLKVTTCLLLLLLLGQDFQLSQAASVPLTPTPTGMYLSIEPTQNEVYAGSTAELNVKVNNAVALYGLQITCNVDPAALTWQSLALSDFFTDPIVGAKNFDKTTGEATLAMSQKHPALPLSGNGIFATFTFAVNAPGSTTISCESFASDRDGFEIPISSPEVSLSVLESSGNVEGSVTYQGRNSHAGIEVAITGSASHNMQTNSSGQFTLSGLSTGDYNLKADAPLYLPSCKDVNIDEQPVQLDKTVLAGGDVDDNDEIRINDATLTGANFGLSETSSPPMDARADFNEDGQVNVQDLSILGGNFGKLGCQNWLPTSPGTPTPSPTSTPSSTTPTPTTPPSTPTPAVTSTPSPALTTITPKKIDDVLYNPGIGMEVPYTGHKYNDSPFPYTRLAYMRFYWSDIEPVRGQIDFELFDRLLAEAERENQKFATRINTIKGGTTAVPQWLADKVGGKYYDDDTFWPNYNHPEFAKEVDRLLTALGDRYGDHPAFNHIDIGFLGCWGEANKACLSGEPEIWSVETRQKIIDSHFKAFPNIPKVELGQFGWQYRELGGYDSYAHDKGAGWRVDCFGDEDHYTTHYKDMIAKAPDAWKNGHIALETCYNMSNWKQHYGYSKSDFQRVMDMALEWHASSINNKGNPVPSDWMPILLETLKKLGYRLAIDELEHTTTSTVGGEIEVRMKWQNLGVAPPYHPYSVVMEFVPEGGGSAWQHEFTTADVRDWLPGSYTISETIAVPDDVAAGNYQIRIGLLYPHNQEPAIQLGNEGKDADGWYSLSQVTIKP